MNPISLKDGRLGAPSVVPAILAALAAAVLAASCGATDVVAKFAARSFGTAADALGSPSPGEYRILASPGGEELRLSADPGYPPRAILSLDAAPFLEAGLDGARLPSGPDLSWTVEGGRLTGRFALGTSPLGGKPDGSPADHLAALAASARDRIGYHAQLGHYGLSLGGGNLVEWAAEPDKNDKDWVLILDPAFLAAAGVDPSRIRGWTLAKVPVDGPDGKMIEVEKLLLPYDLR